MIRHDWGVRTTRIFFRRRCPIGTYKRLPRTKAKPHDDFKDWTLHAILWIKKHWKSALELVGLAVVIFAVVVGASEYWLWRSNSAARGLYSAERLSDGSDEQVAALTGIVDDYSRTPAGKQAMMKLGDLYLKRGDFDLAVKQFGLLTGKSRNHPMLYIAAMHRLAEAQLALGDANAAAETYLKAAADPHNLVSQDSRLRAAECLERAKEFEQAARLYRQVIDEAGEDDMQVKNKSEERLLWLISNRSVEG